MYKSSPSLISSPTMLLPSERRTIGASVQRQREN